MSNSQERSESKSESHADSHTETHESPIKTPKQLAVVILVSFLVPVILLIMLAQMVSFGVSGSSGSDALGAEATAKRISPVASYEFVDANAPRVFQTGEQIYQQVCAACHSAGVAGAPKVGDNAAWKPLIDSGLDEMVKIAIAGKGAMPPKGGNPALSDFEITRAVVLRGKGAMPPKGGAMTASEDDIRAAVQYMAQAAK